ncbi:hypothetical protein HYV85_03830 [Candidatus Woesearchaeota archaeon]|nr:hypothetical protein [Candidatus Woesearchaeota archaeon]
MNGMNGKKRTFSELRHTILIALLPGQQTTNQVSIITEINWRTVEAHLTFLIGKGLVTEVLKSEYVRIFRLTDAGQQHANGLVQQRQETGAGMEKIEKEKMVDA